LCSNQWSSGNILLLSGSFPSDEKYALVQQINKAAVSVASNITEGTSRNGYQEKIHFINISYSSPYFNHI